MAAKPTVSGQMAETYDPKTVERWYDWWNSEGYFKPSEDKDKKPFVIVLPPPNVTGYLHLGHALTGSVQDTLIRYQRMRGRNCLYLPGTDHAGIATQVVVEKRLKAEEGKSRHDLGREKFLERVWDWKNERTGVIQEQLRRTGSSLDWSRERFTMDDHCQHAVTEAFVKLHEDGKIYRATRLVNWCCALQSAISDLEVEFDDVEKSSKTQVPGYDKKVDMGTLTHIAYKVTGSDEELVIATTRPETLLGDTAVAIHPEDKRYKHLHGKTLDCPFRDATIPIVLDSVLVDMEFGTGAVKITPAHDPNDFESGKRHKLEEITVMDLKGFISMEGPFKGQHRFECRKELIKALEEKKLLRNIEPYSYRVGRCSRTGDIVEPMLMPQWFVDCDEMAAKSVAAVRNKELKLTPESHEAVWYHWLENIKPWCVSRQLWWGHRIPAYQVIEKGTPTDKWVVARDEAEAQKKAKEQFKLDGDVELRRDPDVLDTWFSSALWPFSTMGWPEKTPDFEMFFPGSLLETGHDILFFWVARMVMASYHFTGKLPFTEVYLHAMVRDKEGRKMSKSLGNVIDPLDVIEGTTLENLHEKVAQGNLDAKEIPKALKYQKAAFPNGIEKCGSDALRFGLLSYTQSGKNVNLDIERIVGYRSFCNKLWNVTRYILYFALGDDFKPIKTSYTPKESEELPFECRWILSRLESAIKECNEGFSEGSYDFALATNAAYHFFLYELCDVFLELTKPVMQAGGEIKQQTQDVLLYAVEKGLRMLHPMMPFVTEELWHRLPGYSQFSTSSIMMAEYPQPAGFANEKVEANMKTLMDTVHALRSMKASYNLTKKVKPDVWIAARTPELLELMSAQQHIVGTLAVVGVTHAISSDSDAAPGCGFNNVNKDVGVHMMLKGLIDVEKEVKKLEKQVTLLTKSLEGLEKKMTMKGYEDKVPADVQKANSEKKVSLAQQIEQVKEAIEGMKKMN